MCGIIGYIGYRKASPILIEGLKKLEYRGYDSAGIALIENNSLSVIKSSGRIEELEKKLNITKNNSTIGIGHTRWATHGKPTEANAHPHTDTFRNIAIVHNGIIENYAELKQELLNEGITFASETDSEIIAHLISKNYTIDLEDAVRKTLSLLVGAYGLAIISKNEEKIIAVRKSSPLIIGLGNKENLISSDINAISEITKKFIHLDDEEMAIITKDSCIIKNLSGALVEKNIKENTNALGIVSKGEYAHFMLKEIMEQSNALTNTLAGRLKEGKVKLSIDFDVNKIKRVIILGCGTSYNSGIVGKYLIEKIAQVPTQIEYASEFKYRNVVINPDDLVVVISQSGETADTLNALRKVKQFGAKTIGIVNVVGSSISREVDSGIYLHCGPEIGVASTKAFTTQVACLNLLADFIAQEKKIPFSSKELESIPEKVSEVLLEADKIREIAFSLKETKLFLCLGKGFNYATSLEGALKIKEITYTPTEGFTTAEMKHGPISLVDENTWSIFVVSKNDNFEKTISNMSEIKARNGKVLTITNSISPELSKLSDKIITVPLVKEELEPIVNIVPLQLLAYYLAVERGLDPDKPRNLAKSVTVE